MRTPAIAITTDVWPAATTPTFLVAIAPWLVSTPETAPEASRRIAFASPFWMMSTARVDAARRRCARITPGDRVVPRRAAAPLQRCPHDWIADVARDVEDRTEGLGLFGREPFVVNPAQAIGVHVAFSHLHVMGVVRQHHHPAWRIHDVLIELPRQALPQLQRVFIERCRFLPEVIGADDRGVAPGIAAAEPALLQHRDIVEAVLLGEIIGGREPMPAGTDDDRIIGRLRLRVAPL